MMFRANQYVTAKGELAVVVYGKPKQTKAGPTIRVRYVRIREKPSTPDGAVTVAVIERTEQVIPVEWIEPTHSDSEGREIAAIMQRTHEAFPDFQHAGRSLRTRT